MTLNHKEKERVYRAAKGGRATQEIVFKTGISEGKVIGYLQELVTEHRLIGLPKQAPWYVFWAHL